MKTQDEPQIAATMTRWAVNLGCHRDVLKRRLNEQQIAYDEGTKLTAAQILRAMVGDKEAALTRKINADADDQERKNKIADGELLQLPVIEKKLWVDLLQPLRLQLEQLAEQMAGLCNPENPDVAKKVLQQWAEGVKATIKEPSK